MRKLLQDEREIRVARQHWSVFIPTALISILLVALLLLLAREAPSRVGSTSVDDLRNLVVVAGIAAVALFFTGRWLRWRYTTFILTDRRVMVGTGVLSRHTESIALDRVQDTAVRQTLLARVFHAGDVEIESAGRDGSEVLARIHDPQGFSNDLLNAVEAHRAGRGFFPEETAPPPGYHPPGAAGYGPPAGYSPPPRRDGL